MRVEIDEEYVGNTSFDVEIGEEVTAYCKNEDGDIEEIHGIVTDIYDD